jgi:hypothetical protein
VLGVTVQPLGVQEAKDIDAAFAVMTQEHPDALFMITDVLTLRYTQQVLDFWHNTGSRRCFKAVDPWPPAD